MSLFNDQMNRSISKYYLNLRQFISIIKGFFFQNLLIPPCEFINSDKLFKCDITEVQYLLYSFYCQTKTSYDKIYQNFKRLLRSINSNRFTKAFIFSSGIDAFIMVFISFWVIVCILIGCLVKKRSHTFPKFQTSQFQESRWYLYSSGLQQSVVTLFYYWFLSQMAQHRPHCGSLHFMYQNLSWHGRIRFSLRKIKAQMIDFMALIDIWIFYFPGSRVSNDILVLVLRLKIDGQSALSNSYSISY